MHGCQAHTAAAQSVLAVAAAATALQHQWLMQAPIAEGKVPRLALHAAHVARARLLVCLLLAMSMCMPRVCPWHSPVQVHQQGDEQQPTKAACQASERGMLLGPLPVAGHVGHVLLALLDVIQALAIAQVLVRIRAWACRSLVQRCDGQDGENHHPCDACHSQNDDAKAVALWPLLVLAKGVELVPERLVLLVLHHGCALVVHEWVAYLGYARGLR